MNAINFELATELPARASSQAPLSLAEDSSDALARQSDDPPEWRIAPPGLVRVT
jgi:hypothetical protein